MPSSQNDKPKTYCARWDKHLTEEERTEINYLRHRRRRAIMQGDRKLVRTTSARLFELTEHYGFKCA